MMGPTLQGVHRMERVLTYKVLGSVLRAVPMAVLTVVVPELLCPKLHGSFQCLGLPLILVFQKLPCSTCYF